MSYFDKANHGKTGDGTAYNTSHDPIKAWGKSRPFETGAMLSFHIRKPDAKFRDVMPANVLNIGYKRKK
jgi:hypothetical protein